MEFRVRRCFSFDRVHAWNCCMRRQRWPGYRNQSGKRVGWEALARQCGNPPSTKCMPENVAEGSEDAAAKGATIRSFMDRSHAAKTPAGN